MSNIGSVPPAGAGYSQTPQRRRIRLGLAFRIVTFLLLLASLTANVVLVVMLMGSLAAYNGLRALDSVAPGPGVRQVVVHRGKHKRIAIIPLDGTILGGAVDTIHDCVRLVERHKKIKAVVLRVDSPGGGLTASDEIYHDLMKLRARHVPIVVSMGAMAASGAYYASMAGQEIYAEPTTTTGSIGVMLPDFQLTGLMKKIGVKPEIITSDQAVYKEIGSPFGHFKPSDILYIKKLLNSAQGRFRAVVQRGRAGRLKAPIDHIAVGKIWTARRALALGLIDKIGYLGAACRAAEALAHLRNATIVRLEPRGTLLDQIGVKTPIPTMRLQLSPQMLRQMLYGAIYGGGGVQAIGRE